MDLRFIVLVWYRFGTERPNDKLQKPNNIQILNSNIKTLRFKKPNFFEKLGFSVFIGKSWAFFIHGLKVHSFGFV